MATEPRPTPRLRNSTGRLTRTCHRGLLLTAIGTFAISLTPAAAVAAPSAPGSADEAAALVADRGHQLEVLTEDYNEAREQVQLQQQAAAAAAAVVAESDAQVARLEQQLAGVAQSAYAGQGLGSLQAFMTSSSPEDVLDRMSTLELIAQHHNKVIDQVAAAQAAADEARMAAEAAATQAQQQLDSVADKQTVMQSEIAGYRSQYETLSAAEQEQADVLHGGAALAAPPAAAVVATTEAAQTAVDTAMAQLGDPYVWAAAGPDAFDCSGLVQYAYAAAGIALPHSSVMQAGMGRPVSRADLQPGDLVYYYSPISHIGIYIGGGKFVHATTFGSPVEVGSVDMAGYAGARRITA